MEQEIKPNLQQNNHIEITRGDSFKNFGKGNQNINKNTVNEKKSYVKEAIVTLVIGLVLAFIVWYLKLNGIRQ